MSASASRAKKTRKTGASSSLSHPAVSDASSLAHISEFSHTANLFAFVSLSVDKHRLRIYDTTTEKAVAETIVDQGRITCLKWINVNLSENTEEVDVSPSASKKRGKRKRVEHGEPVASAENLDSEVVALGLSDGSIVIFSPTHGRVVRTLSHPKAIKSTLSIISAKYRNVGSALWTTGEDGYVRIWNLRTNELLASLKFEDGPCSSLAIRSQDENQVQIIVANHTIKLLSLNTSVADSELQADVMATFTGHVTPISGLYWESVKGNPVKFVSSAESDRNLNIWSLPQSPSTEGHISASIAVDSDVRLCRISSSTIVVLSASGKVYLYTVPSQETERHTKSGSLTPRSIIHSSHRKSNTQVEIIAASFTSETRGSLKLARLSRGIRPTFEQLTYLDSSGAFIQNIDLKYDDDEALTATEAPDGARYIEKKSLAIQSGTDVSAPHDQADSQDINGDLNVDLAELSLGQRLTAVNGQEGGHNSSDDEGVAGEEKTTSHIVPANSLTRTLIQALHSSDSRLLETCLAHSDQNLIRNTVRKLPPQLAVPLLLACVERLGRGARGQSMKGGGGGASAQRGTALIGWIKAVLVAHSAHLMTISDLVARLSSLHSTLSSRISLQESLLSLSGRLDMVLAQAELRSSSTPAALGGTKGAATNKNQKRRVTRYVEGESESDEDENDEDEEQLEVDNSDQESIEDVQLGDSEEDEDDEEGEDDEDDEDDEDEDDDGMNGFIDDEAEEEYETDSEDRSD